MNGAFLPATSGNECRCRCAGCSALSAILAVKPKRQASFIVHEIGLQNTNDMQDNRNECKDEPIQEAVSRTYHQEPENGLDKVALVQLAEAGNK